MHHNAVDPHHSASDITPLRLGPDRRIAAVARSLHVAPSTVWRWIRRGVRAADGSIIRLDYVRLGRRILIEPEAIERFAAAVADADRRALHPTTPGVPRSPTPGSLADIASSI